MRRFISYLDATTRSCRTAEQRCPMVCQSWPPLTIGSRDGKPHRAVFVFFRRKSTYELTTSAMRGEVALAGSDHA
jgi:hypothetical protein